MNIESHQGLKIKKWILAPTIAACALTAACAEEQEPVPAIIADTESGIFGDATLNDGSSVDLEAGTAVLAICQGNWQLRTRIMNGPYAGFTSESIPPPYLDVLPGPDYGERRVDMLVDISDLPTC